jgi:hypothetical protein
MRIIGSERERFATAQFDQYGIEAGNIVEPTTGC